MLLFDSSNKSDVKIASSVRMSLAKVKNVVVIVAEGKASSEQLKAAEIVCPFLSVAFEVG